MNLKGMLNKRSKKAAGLDQSRGCVGVLLCSSTFAASTESTSYAELQFQCRDPKPEIFYSKIGKPGKPNLVK